MNTQSIVQLVQKWVWYHKSVFHAICCAGLVQCCFFFVSDQTVFVSDRYRSGIRGHMKAVVMDLLRQYLKVEIQFQNGEGQLQHTSLWWHVATCKSNVVLALLSFKFFWRVALSHSVHLVELFHYKHLSICDFPCAAFTNSCTCWFVNRTLWQVRVCTAWGKQRRHGQRAQLHLLPCSSHQEEPAGYHADCKCLSLPSQK